jgi:hypothetical protein
MWEPRRLTTISASTACYRKNFTFLYRYCNYSQDRSVGIATRLRAGWPLFDSRQGEEFFLLHSIQTGSGNHPDSYLIDIVGSFPGVKQWKCETRLYLMPRSRMVELHLHSTYVSAEWCIIKHEGNVTFSLPNFGFEILTAVTMMISLPWNLMPCSSVKVNRCFGMKISPPSSGLKNKPSKNPPRTLQQAVLVWHFFDPEDGGDMLPRNVG